MKKKRMCSLWMVLLCGMLFVGCGQTPESKHSDAAQQEENPTEGSYHEDVPQTEETQQIEVSESQEALSENSYIFDFQGVNTTVEAPKWGNHVMNLKQSISGLVCPDEENGVTYYVNCGRDNYLYRLENGESTLVLSQVVSSLNIWEGELYFVLHEDGDIRGLGNICKWNPLTDEQETIIEGQIKHFRMNENGVYFVEGQLQEFEGGYIISLYPKFYSFEEDCVTEHPYGNGDFYGDYIMQRLVANNELEGVGLYHPDRSELIPVYPYTADNFRINECIFENYYYGVRNDEEQFTWINLQDGTINEVGTAGIDATWVKLKDYSELGGEIYLSLESDMLARLDQESHSLVPITIQTGQKQYLSLEEIEAGQYEEEIFYTYQELYTDGEALYALKHYIIDLEQPLPDGLLLVQLLPEGDSFVEVALGDGNDE